jgi:hypothetical protein
VAAGEPRGRHCWCVIIMHLLGLAPEGWRDMLQMGGGVGLWMSRMTLWPLMDYGVLERLMEMRDGLRE